MKRQESDSTEPNFYLGLIMRGNEKQYLDLLKYLGSHNGAQVIYQCKSLTYLIMSRDDGVKCEVAEPELLIEPSMQSMSRRREKAIP